MLYPYLLFIVLICYAYLLISYKFNMMTCITTSLHPSHTTYPYIHPLIQLPYLTSPLPHYLNLYLPTNHRHNVSKGIPILFLATSPHPSHYPTLSIPKGNVPTPNRLQSHSSGASHTPTHTNRWHSVSINRCPKPNPPRQSTGVSSHSIQVLCFCFMYIFFANFFKGKISHIFEIVFLSSHRF